MKTILRAAMAAILIGGLSLPAQADEIEEALQMALEAYQAGDINAAKEEIDYAAQLIAQLKAVGLSGFLPDPLPDWTRVKGEDKTQTAALLGGGMTASATYTRGNDGIDIQLMADNQMVTTISTRKIHFHLLTTVMNTRINRLTCTQVSENKSMNLLLARKSVTSVIHSIRTSHGVGALA